MPDRLQQLEKLAQDKRLSRAQKAELLLLREAEHVQKMSTEMRMPDETGFDSKPFDSEQPE